MKTVRIEYHITASIHVGEGVDEGPPPENAALYTEEITVKRVAQLNGFFAANEAGDIYATTKAHAVALLAGVAHVLPEKLAYGIRNKVSR